MTPPLPAWASDLIGSQLARIRALAFFLPGHTRTETFQFELENDRGAVWTLLTGLDGESIDPRPGPIDDSNTFFDEDLGYSNVVDESSPEISAALHKDIEFATSFLLYESVLIGIRLVMKGGASLEIFNVGDDLALFVNRETPSSMDAAISWIEHHQVGGHDT